MWYADGQFTHQMKWNSDRRICVCVCLLSGVEIIQKKSYTALYEQLKENKFSQMECSIDGWWKHKNDWNGRKCYKKFECAIRHVGKFIIFHDKF